MDPESQQRIEMTVRQVLEESDIGHSKEYKVREDASEWLKMDLSQPEFRVVVREVVEAFLREQNAKEEQQAKEDQKAILDQQKVKGDQQSKEDQENDDHGDEGSGGKKSQGVKVYTDVGEPLICRLSANRMVTIQKFKTKLVSIREYYQRQQDGKELPKKKGISLTREQWRTLRKNVPAVEDAIKKKK